MVSEMHWCPQCRQPLQAGYIFCPSCGARLDASPSGMVQPTRADHLGRNMAVRERRSRKGLLVLFCIVAAVVVIFVVQSAFGPATKASGNTQSSVATAESSQPSSSPSDDTTQPSSEASVENGSGQTPAASSSSNAAVAKNIGDTLSVGYWSYCVNGDRWTPYISNFGEVQRANADYLVLDISARNDDNSASTLPSVKLVNDAGEEFSESPMLGDGFLNPMTTLNPHVVTRGLVVFDAPLGHYRVELSGGLTSNDTAFVNLVSPTNSPAPQTAPTTSAPQATPATPAPQATPQNSGPTGANQLHGA